MTTTIAFDTWVLANRFRNTGIYVYAKQLLHHFREMAAEYSVEIRPFISPGLSDAVDGLQPTRGFHPVRSRSIRFGHLWRYGSSCLSALTNRADVIFNPSGSFIPVKSFLPAVATIHDITPTITPFYYRRRSSYEARFLLSCCARLSQAVITDSLCSKRDLVEVFRLPESKVSVVYVGYDKDTFNDAPADPEAQRACFLKLGLNKPYVFHHGTIQPRKNLSRLIEAFRFLTRRNPNLDFDLVLAGALGWKYEDVLESARKTSEGGGRVVIAGALSDQEIALLVKGSSLVVIPSLYEGFCLPMIESMACGTPTIASDTSCLPEVSGGVLKYFNPESIDDMADCMERTLEDSSLRQKLSHKGRERAHSFDWRRCAQQTLSILAAFQN